MSSQIESATLEALTNSQYYLYGIALPTLLTAARADGNAARSILQAKGVDGLHPVFLWPCAGLVAVLSEVGPEEFCGPLAEENLKQLAWVGPRATQHHAVVAEIMRLGPIAPARFGTLFSSPESLGGFLEQHREVIAGFLERTANQAEWSVKGVLDRDRAEAVLAARLRSGQEATWTDSPGRRYLEEQRIRLGVQKDLRVLLEKTGDKLAAELAPYATEVHQNPVSSLQTGSTGSEPGEIVWHWVILMPRSAQADFQIWLEAANAELSSWGLSLLASGPWPPYSFCPRLEAERGA